MKAPKPKTALAPAPKKAALSLPDRLTVADNIIGAELATVAQALSSAPTPGALAAVTPKLNEWAKALDDMMTATKRYIVEVLEAQGEVTSEKGGRSLEVDGMVLSMRPTRTGLDPKKVEAAVRARGFGPGSFMTPTVVHSLDDTTAGKLEAAGFDLESLKYNQSWAVQPVKPVRKDNEDE